MPTIKENQLSGKTISYRFTVCLGRDQAGKQIRKTTTWRPPEGTTPSKARKMAEQEAKRWELSLTEEEPPAPPPPPEPEQRKDDFVKFIDSVWFPLAIEQSLQTVSFSLFKFAQLIVPYHTTAEITDFC